MKVFGIGLHKTGTTTLGRCLQRLGFKHQSYDKKLLQFYLRGELAKVFRVTDRYSSFEDWPFPLMYQELFERYGSGARYVLTTRASSEIWLDSLKAHSIRINPRENERGAIYGYDYPHGHEAEHIAYYERHNSNVRSFFVEKGAQNLLLPVCWETGDGWKELCAFLGAPVPNMPFPNAYSRVTAIVNPSYRAENEHNVAVKLAALNKRMRPTD